MRHVACKTCKAEGKPGVGHNARGHASWLARATKAEAKAAKAPVPAQSATKIPKPVEKSAKGKSKAPLPPAEERTLPLPIALFEPKPLPAKKGVKPAPSPQLGLDAWFQRQGQRMRTVTIQEIEAADAAEGQP